MRYAVMAAVILLTMTLASISAGQSTIPGPGNPTPTSAEQSMTQNGDTRSKSGGQEQMAGQRRGRVNLFLAPEQVRRARGQQGSKPTSQGSTGTPRVPSELLPPPPLVGLPSVPPSLSAKPPEGGKQSPKAASPGASSERGKSEKVERPELVGIVGGRNPQVILELAGRIVVARLGEQTPWGKVISAGDGEAVLRTKSGKMTLRVYIEGVKRWEEK